MTEYSGESVPGRFQRSTLQTDLFCPQLRHAAPSLAQCLQAQFKDELCALGYLSPVNFLNLYQQGKRLAS